MEGVGDDEAGVEEILHERVVEFGEIRLGTSAAHDMGDSEAFCFCGAARTPGDLPAGLGGGLGEEGAVMEEEAVVALQHSVGIHDLGGAAVAVDVPIGAEMAQEALFFFEREALPELLVEGAERVDDAVPGGALPRRELDFGADGAHEGAGGGRNCGGVES